MKELPFDLKTEIQALLICEIRRLWKKRHDAYWRQNIKYHVESLRLFKKNNIYLKEK